MPLYAQVPQRKTWQEDIVPTEMDLKLAQVFLGTISGAAASVVVRYNPNSAYQPQTGGATATVPGFSEMSALYGFYRVVRYQYTVTMINNEAFPVTAYVINSNNDPGTSAGVLTAANALSQSVLLASKGSGSDTHTFRKTLNLSEILGTSAVETADSYRALINASPLDVTWLGLGAQSGTASNITNGVTLLLKLTMYVRFYDRLLQS